MMMTMMMLTKSITPVASSSYPTPPIRIRSDEKKMKNLDHKTKRMMMMMMTMMMLTKSIIPVASSSSMIQFEEGIHQPPHHEALAKKTSSTPW